MRSEVGGCKFSTQDLEKIEVNIMKKYVKTLLIGLAFLGLTGNILGQEKNLPKQIRHTLNSTPDAETEFNTDLAGKVRKVAELIMSKEKGRFDKGEKNIGTRVIIRNFIVTESRGYEFVIYDMNEMVKDDLVDEIRITEYSLTENNERMVYSLFDYGLDGNVNTAYSYIAPTDALFPPEDLIGEEFIYEQLKEIKFFRKEIDGEISIGEEHQKEFQARYEKVLDELIEIYEQDN